MKFPFFQRAKKEVKQNPAGFLGYNSYGSEFSLGRDYQSFADEGYIRNACAFACIEYIATAVSSVPLLGYTNTNGKLQRLDFQHPINKLLRRPNPATGGGNFLHDLLCFKLIAGNAYILMNSIDSNKPPAELWLIRPDYVKVKPGKFGFPSGYCITKNENESLEIPVDPLTGSSPMLHIKNFHPLKNNLGLSKFEPAAYSVDTLTSILKWNKRLLDRGARPSGAFVSSDKLDDVQFARLKEQIDTQYSGSNNAGRALLLEGGFDFKEMQINPKDMDYIQSKNSTARDICLAFGVPPQLIGLPDAQTYSNYEEARLAFWQSTVLPILSCLIDDLTGWLASRYGANFLIDYDKNDIDALAPIRHKQFTMLQLAEFLTPNEKRELVGYGAIDGGDKLYINSRTLPAEMAGLQFPSVANDPQAIKKHFIENFPDLIFEMISNKQGKIEYDD